MKEVLSGVLRHRKQRNPQYSLRRFARQLDLSPGSLSRILSGQRQVGPQTQERILAALGKDLITLYNEFEYFQNNQTIGLIEIHVSNRVTVETLADLEALSQGEGVSTGQELIELNLMEQGKLTQTGMDIIKRYKMGMSQLRLPSSSSKLKTILGRHDLETDKLLEELKNALAGEEGKACSIQISLQA